MKNYQRVFIFLFVALAFTSVLSPWVAALWNSIVDLKPEWQLTRYSFSHIFGRLFMVTGVILFFSFRSRLKIPSLSNLGLAPLRHGRWSFLQGFLIAAASVAALGLLMTLSEIFTPYFRLSLSGALQRSGKALLMALTVGLFEEIFFRGIIFKGLMEDFRPPVAFAMASFFYSAIHFVKPSEKLLAGRLDPLAGVRYLIHAFEPFFDPFTLLPGLFGLFLIGLVLSYAYLRTGSLYLSIGLHAGWVFGIKTIRVYGDFARSDLGRLFGSSEPKLVSGLMTWLGILLVGVVVHFVTRERRQERS